MPEPSLAVGSLPAASGFARIRPLENDPHSPGGFLPRDSPPGMAGHTERPSSGRAIEMNPATGPAPPATSTLRRQPAFSGRISGLILALSLVTFSSWSFAIQACPAVERVHLGSGQRVFYPGESVPFSWASLPQGADEFELLLVCRSPIHVTLRLTECMDPLQGTFRWEVPNLPCDTAQILIRTGVDGEEITWAASPLFRIAWEGKRPFVQVSSRGGELWLSGSTPRPRGTFAWGHDLAAPGRPLHRRIDLGRRAPNPALLASRTSSREPRLDRGRKLERSGSQSFRWSDPLNLQLRI